MRTLHLTFLSVLSGLIIFAAMPAAASDVAVGTVNIDEKLLREAIIQVIQDDPKIVYDAYMAHRQELKKQQEARQLEFSFKHPTDIQVRKGNPVIGPEDAPITIVCFTEFQCPYCARSVATMNELMGMYPGKLRLVYKNNPLPSHSKAMGAAKAALAADMQGKFKEFRDMLFADMSRLNDAGYLQLAGRLGLDLAKFNEDRHSDAVAKIIAADQAEAKQLNLTSVPYFYVNGIPVKGAKSTDYFAMVIDRLMIPKPPSALKK